MTFRGWGREGSRALDSSLGYVPERTNYVHFSIKKDTDGKNQSTFITPNVDDRPKKTHSRQYNSLICSFQKNKLI